VPVSKTVPCCALLAVLLLSACEEERRVPYIPPDLHNWPEAYRGVDGLAVHVFVTGFVRLPAAMVLSGGGATQTRTLPSIAFLIVHPKHGLVAFNTGLESDAEDDDAGGLFGFLQPEIEVGRPLVEQMKAAGFDAAAVRTVVLSSLRRSHLGGIDALPKARIVLSEAEIDHAREHEPDVLVDLEANHELEVVGFEEKAPLGTFTAHEDLLGDGSCLLIDARGPSAGSLVMLIRLRERPLLLAADLAPLPETVRYAARPAQLQEPDAWWDNIWRLKRFADLAPKLLVVPGADLKALESAGLKAVTVHDYVVPPTQVPPSPTPSGWKRPLPLPM
jgi:hypothetical protein